MTMDLSTGTGAPGQMGNSPGLLQWISLFQKYRVYQFIAVTTFTNLTPNPVLVWHQPCNGDTNNIDANVPTPLVSNIPEQRWAKARLLGPAGSTRSLTKIITRINPYKVVSFDRGSATGNAYGIVSNPTTPAIAGIQYGGTDSRAWFRYGITTYNDSIPGATDEVPRVAYHIKVYLKVQHFDRVPINQ